MKLADVMKRKWWFGIASQDDPENNQVLLERVTDDNRRSPGFVLPQDRRPATDALLEFNVLDETGLTVQTQYRNETATVEPTGSFWIESGNILTITATDSAGNLTVKHFANADGTISEALTEIEE